MILNNALQPKRAFTLIELLITISIIVILISMLTLALAQARTAAQIADTQSRLTSLKNATIRFKDDIGYYPAVLDLRRAMAVLPDFPGPDTGNFQTMYRFQAQEWFSITSPAEFLIGYGDQSQDGYGRLPDSQPTDSDYPDVPRHGIRHPGLDGVWRATDEFAVTGNWTMSDRVPSTRGKLYGPYLNLENDQMYGRIAFDSDVPIVDPVTNEVKVFYPGDPNYNIIDPVTGLSNPMVIVDSWGSPIRYYRNMYPKPSNPTATQTGIGRVYPQSNLYNKPTMSDFIVLRPFDFSPESVIDASISDFMNGTDVDNGDTSTSFDLQSGEFAYFSVGPDKRANNLIRADVLGNDGNTGDNATDEVNADNIVEIGP